MDDVLGLNKKKSDKKEFLMKMKNQKKQREQNKK